MNTPGAGPAAWRCIVIIILLLAACNSSVMAQGRWPPKNLALAGAQMPLVFAAMPDDFRRPPAVAPMPLVFAAVQDDSIRPRPVGAVVGGVLVGGMTGFVGGLAGLAIETRYSECDYMFCGLGGFVLGVLGGTTLGIPLGVRMGNGGRGHLLEELLWSIGVGTVGYTIMARSRYGEKLWLVPVVQFGGSLVLELGAR